MYKRLFESIRYVGLIVVMLVFSGGSMANQTNEQCDIDDNGTVNVLDLYRIIGLLGTQSGTENYREGLDLVPDGIIDITDYFELIGSGCFGAAGVDTSPTTVSGKVFDGVGNPLEDVTVQIGTNTVSGQTDEFGVWKLDIPAGDVGDTVITFDGSTAADPTPLFLSGQYPTIPNKPIFVNGGTDIQFRDMSLPERDLTGAVTLDDTNSMAGPGANTRTLDQEIEYNNAGVKMILPADCAVTFPAGEDPVLSITRVDPSMLPVPMPPGLASSIFVTYQPGGTVVNCPNGGAPQLITKFDNVDGFVNSDDLNGPDQPFLAGITNGVFTELAKITVVESDGTPSGVGDVGPLLEANVPTPFEFAWYHVDVPLDPCPRTRIVGEVREFGTNNLVPGAIMSTPGAVNGFTNSVGTFTIVNVPAGPNGPFCTTSPFLLRVSATTTNLAGVPFPAFGISRFVQALPGGETDIGTIFVGDLGTVQGKVQKLFSLDDPLTVGVLEPFSVVPLSGAGVFLFGSGFSFFENTNASGSYTIPGVPVESYTLQATFNNGEISFGGSLNDQIDFNGDIDVHNFNFVSTGSLKVTVMDNAGSAVPNALVQVDTPGGALPGGFQQPQRTLFGTTDFNGMVTFGGDGREVFFGGVNVIENAVGDNEGSGLPLGPCMASVVGGFNGPTLASVDCFINQHGETEEVTIVFNPPPSP